MDRGVNDDIADYCLLLSVFFGLAEVDLMSWWICWTFAWISYAAIWCYQLGM